MINKPECEDQIIVDFPGAVSGIVIKSQDAIVESYKKSGKQIPPFIFCAPHFEVCGVSYYIFPKDDNEK